MGDNASYSMFVETNSQRIPLEIGQLYLLGKKLNGIGNKNFINLEEEEDVEQKHCVIEIGHYEDVFVYDLCSTKGTLINNTLIKTLKKVPLKNGDTLKVGKQEVKYVRDQLEMSHDSSGFLEINKNASDIIASSPDSKSQQENRKKRLNNNFLVPPMPSKKSVSPDKSLVLKNTEDSSSINALNIIKLYLATSNRRSNSFTIPETQYDRTPNSSNDSNLSIAESLPDVVDIKNVNLFEDDNDFCIPETQDARGDINCSQRPRVSSEGRAKEKIILFEDSSNVEDGTKENEGSQFRICTQDFNDGFGEEADKILSSQIIPWVKHNTVILNNTTESSMENSKLEVNLDKEMTLKWSNARVDQETKALRADCSTPDLLEFGGNYEQQQIAKDNDEEDSLPTQVFPYSNIKLIKDKIFKDQEKPFLEKENEVVLTLSDKENRCPFVVEPIIDSPVTQVFEVPAARSATSSFSNSSLTEGVLKTNTSTTAEKNKDFLNIDFDEEDDMLTQALLRPTNLPSSSSPKNIPIKCFNSTVLEDKFTISPAAFFKKPDKDLSDLRKISSATSSTSETDLDLLMSTPQFIKEHIQVDKTEDLKRHILAVKNKHLFGDDTEEEEDDDQGDLVKLINIPKDSLDFDKLLPHLCTKPNCKIIDEEKIAAKETKKLYKFNISFGKESEKKSKSSTLCRDERHVARDKERELAERKERMKTKSVNNSYNKGKTQQTKTRKTETPTIQEENKPETSEQKEINKRTALEKQDGKTTRYRKRQLSTEKPEKPKGCKKKEQSKEMPTRDMTCSKSIYDETPSTSKDAIRKISNIEQHEEDDLDSVATQPFVRITRCRSTSKQTESQDSISSNNSLSHKTSDCKPSANENIAIKTGSERKRKADATTPVVPVKVDRNRCISTHSSNSSTSKSSLSSPINISMTMVDPELFKDLVKNCKGLWKIAKDPAESELLVMDKAYRTFKFLLAMARGIPIVTSEYLKKINESSTAKKVRISNYRFTDAEFEKKHKFSLNKSLQIAENHKIFKGYEFVMTSSILPNPQEIKAIIEASGGIVHAKAPPGLTENQEIYLVTCKDDKKEWHKFRRLNKNITIVSTEAIMSAVMRQTCECMASYILS